MNPFSIFTFLFIFSFISLFSSVKEFPNLEKSPSDMVLSLKKLEIAGYPHAFNPSLVRWKGNLLLSFRELIEPCQSVASASESFIGLIWLDEAFNPISDPYFLDLGKQPTLAEDARLVNVGRDLYVIYSSNEEEIITDAGFRMTMAKLEFENNEFKVVNKQALTYFEGEQANRREKNWVPFDYQGHLCLAYSLKPHRIFLPVDNTQCCYTLSETNPNISWKWGELRGGTPAVNIDERYLSFFHSSINIATTHSEGAKVPHYFIGAYLFQNEPPFAITHVSPKPIIAKGFYSGKTYEPYWHPVRAIFPCGIVAEDKHIWITYGRQDHEIWVAKIDRFKLLKSLIPVKKLF